MNENKSLVSIIVFGYDSYSDAWPYFDYFFNKHWRDCHLRRLFVSVDKNGPSSFECLLSHNDEAYLRLKCGLDNTNSEYILILLEDYCLSKEMNDSYIINCVHQMRKHNLDYLELSNFCRKTKKEKLISKEDKNALYGIKKNTNYRISLQPSIWKRELLDVLIMAKCDSLWAMEDYFNDPIKSKSDSIEAGVVRPIRFCVNNLIDKGYINPKMLSIIKKNELPLPKRDIMPLRKYFYMKVKKQIISVLPDKLLLRILEHKRKK